MKLGVIMANDSGTCLACTNLVPKDIVKPYACNVICVASGLTLIVYRCYKGSLQAGRKVERFPILCPNCIDEWRSTKPQVQALASKIKGLQVEASEVPLLEHSSGT